MIFPGATPLTGPAWQGHLAGMAQIDSIYRYPVKGLSPERLPRAALTIGQTIAGDRKYAIENGPSGFDPLEPRHQPKQRYLMLMKNERLATLDTRYDDMTQQLVIRAEGEEAARGDLGTIEGRAAIEAFFTRFSADDLHGPPKVLQADGFSFSDVAKKVVSIINLASVADLETATGVPVHPLRFRGNVYVSGWPAWHEFDLLNQEISLGDAQVKIIKRIVRCAATNVDPDTGIRDLNIPQTLMRTYGHADCGVYAEVITGGTIKDGDDISSSPSLFA